MERAVYETIRNAYRAWADVEWLKLEWNDIADAIRPAKNLTDAKARLHALYQSVFGKPPLRPAYFVADIATDKDRIEDRHSMGPRFYATPWAAGVVVGSSCDPAVVTTLFPRKVVTCCMETNLYEVLLAINYPEYPTKLDGKMRIPPRYRGARWVIEEVGTVKPQVLADHARRKHLVDAMAMLAKAQTELTRGGFREAAALRKLQHKLEWIRGEIE